MTIKIKTVTEGNKLAVENKFAKVANFTGMPIESVNIILNALEFTHKHFPSFPTLEFLGEYYAYAKFMTPLKFYELNEKKLKRSSLTEDQIIAFLGTKKLAIKSKDAVATSHKFVNGTYAIVFYQYNIEDTTGKDYQIVKTKTVYHEIGHIFDFMIGITGSNKEIKRKFREFRKEMKWNNSKNWKEVLKNREEILSDYAYESTSEFFAEAWGYFFANEKPRELESKIAEIAIELYKNEYGDYVDLNIPVQSNPPQYLPMPVKMLNDTWTEIRYKAEFARSYIPCREIMLANISKPVKPVNKAEPVKSESPAAVKKAEPVKKSGAVKEAHPVKKSSPKNEMPNILTAQAFKTCYEESGNAEQEIYELLMECKKKEILDAVKKIFGMTPGRGCQKSLEILCRHFAQRIIFRLKTQANKPVKAVKAPTPVKKSEPVKAENTVKRISFEECIARYSKENKPKRKAIQHTEQLTFTF